MQVKYVIVKKCTEYCHMVLDMLSRLSDKSIWYSHAVTDLIYVSNGVLKVLWPVIKLRLEFWGRN